MILVVHDANTLFLLCFALFPQLPVPEDIGTEAANITQIHIDWSNTVVQFLQSNYI